MSDEQLLDVRLCDLPLQIEGTALEQRVKRLDRELERRGVRFKPRVWLSEEWFTPDGVAGFAIPFYLAHPRLVRLERKQMLEAEGGTTAECMRLLRHEAGHALNNAFRFHRKRQWQELFGSFAAPYPHSYQPRPNSRNYVLHLGAWYAQAHPAEDFAETFAVWLTPGSQWRRRYRGWAALRKLAYVNRLMQEIAQVPPKTRHRNQVEPLSRIKRTLREHYQRKRRYYASAWPAVYDRDLRRIFSPQPQRRSRFTAAAFLRRHASELRHSVAEATGVHHYTVDHVLRDMIERCKQLRLRVTTPLEQARERAMILLTVQTMNVVQAGYSRVIV
jgi:hypothetical protein